MYFGISRYGREHDAHDAEKDRKQLPGYAEYQAKKPELNKRPERRLKP
jgi:hypothetical protein